MRRFRGLGPGGPEIANLVLRSFVSRWPFLAAVAIVSAAVSDVVVEAAANTGAFGPAYFDTNDASIVPALAAAVILALTVIGLHVRAACRRSSEARRGWLRDAARSLCARRSWADFPFIAGMQFAALFSMESAEQVLAGGRLTGGLGWLGGPVPVGVSAHLAIGLACTLAAGWLMRVSAARFVRLVWIALEFVLCSRARAISAAFVPRGDGTVLPDAQSARARHIRERAPPFSPIPQLTFVYF